jgi:hypothetical protein
MTDDIFPLAACFLFSVLLYSSVGQPIHWVCMALAYRHYVKIKIDNNCNGKQFIVQTEKNKLGTNILL